MRKLPIRVHLVMTLSSIIILTAGIAYAMHSTPLRTGPSEIHAAASPGQLFKQSTEIPPAPSRGKGKNKKMIYVIVLDTAFQPERYHCVAYEQWMKPLLEFENIDGIEIYSPNSWIHELCDLSSIGVPISHIRENPNTEVLYKALQMYLERSSAGWLWIIEDAAHIRVDSFMNFTKKRIQIGYPTGNCIERRYFFQMYPLSSGVLMSRNAVSSVLAKEQTWDVCIQAGIDASEALSQILDSVGIRIKRGRSDKLLGWRFDSPSHYNALMNKRFNSLGACTIPSYIFKLRPGLSTICSNDITQFSKVVVWAGAPNATSEGKLEFLTKAAEMMANIPKHIKFYWNRLYPTLCNAQL